jgi:hypothetical protein
MATKNNPAVWEESTESWCLELVVAGNPNSGIYTFIDRDDIERIQGYTWKGTWVSGSYRPYAYIDQQRKQVFLYRFLFDEPKGFDVDHWDGDTLNNRRKNLRIATHQQNLANQKLSSASTSGYKGVTLDQRKKKDGTPLEPSWMAQAKHNGKRVYIGKFPSPEAAARAYDRKMIELHGEFARTNESLGLLPPDDGSELERQIHLGANARGGNRWKTLDK